MSYLSTESTGDKYNENRRTKVERKVGERTGRSESKHVRKGDEVGVCEREK